MGLAARTGDCDEQRADPAVGERLHARWEQLGSALLRFVNRRQLEKEGFHLGEEKPEQPVPFDRGGSASLF